MKTPKVDTPKPKNKFNTPKGGLVRKSLGQTPAKNLKKLTAKGADHVLSMVKDNEENIDFKNKSMKTRMSLPADVLSNKSPAHVANGKTPKKLPKVAAEKSPEIPEPSKKQSISHIASKKVDKLGTPLGDSKQQNLSKTPVNKNTSRILKGSVSVENNSSPIKKNINVQKSKVPLNLNDSLFNTTPNETKQMKNGSPANLKPISPEVELGLQLEVALSPKSKKEKMKKFAINAKLNAKGKTEVTKKAVKSDDLNEKSGDEPKPNKTKSGNENKGEPKPSMLKHLNALNSVNALLKSIAGKKNDLLEPDQNIFLQFNLVKQAKDSRGVYKVSLPHCILPDNPDICLVVPDLKGKRNEPEEAIDHYKQLLKNNNITVITEIISFRKLKQEYSQYEERRKLANRFDRFLIDTTIMRVGRFGNRFARSKKIVCPVDFNKKNLKEEIERSLKKVPIFCSGLGTSFSVKVGRRGMPAKQIADNIVTIGEFLANNEVLVGEASNLSTIVLKTENSPAYPIYVSTVTPNEVKKPMGKKQVVEGPVEDEVTTVQDATVVVYPSGNVKVNKRKNLENDGGVVKENPSKKAKTNVVKQGKVEFDSDESDDDSYDDSEDITDSELSMDEEEDVSDVEEDSDDVEEEEGEGEDDDDDQSLAEEEIELAEKEYLQELRQLQDEAGKPKAKKGGKVQKEGIKGKQNSSQGKKLQPVQEKKGNPVAQQNKKESVKQQGGSNQTNKKQLDNKQPQQNKEKPNGQEKGAKSPQNKRKQFGQGKRPNVETPQTKGKPFGQGKGRENSPQNKGKPFGQGKGRENFPQNKGKPFGQGKGRENSPQNKGKPFGQGKGRENSPQNKGKPFGQGKGRENSPQNKGKPFGQGKGRENSPQNKGKPFGQGKGRENLPQNKGKPFGQGKGRENAPKNKGRSTGQQAKGPNNKGSPGLRGNKQQNFKKGTAGKN